MRLPATLFAPARTASADLQLVQVAIRSPDVNGGPAMQPHPACRTSVEGDECYEMVMWAMRTGVVENPDWFAPLTRNSSFEDFQRHTSRLSAVCPEPCAAPAPEECRTSVEGDECYERVVWAMRTGVLERPDWYPSLTRDSSFEDFQRFLHGQAGHSHVCPRPCASAPEECRTSVEGDECYERVVWAMRTGVLERPDWYPSLSRGSSFEDFQRLRHGQARRSHVCPRPCFTREATERVPAATVRSPTSAPAPSPTPIGEEDLLAASYPGFMQKGRNCQCGNTIGQFSEEFETLALCAYECTLYESCQSIGLHPAESVWSGACTLFDAPCDDTDGNDDNTTCADPSPHGSVSINFNRVDFGTPAPTIAPVPTIPPDSCDVIDGSSPSSLYPCMCGSSFCGTNQICSARADSCGPVGFFMVDWPCSNPAIASPYFSLSGVSAIGSPIYSNFAGNYIYWDASCDGSGGDTQGRWILDQGAPNTTASMDLDSDGDCVYFGHHLTSEFLGPPLGNSTWTVACDGVQSAMTVPITHLPSLPTPAPTLEPGVPCACGAACGGFLYVDVDGDGCLSESECSQVDELLGHFSDMDADGDSCVTQEECAASPYATLLPSFKVTAPECDYGFYVAEGTSVCVECSNGETRRRRATLCTECPPGKTDPGDFDDCISGAWLVQLVSVGDDVIVVNQDTDEYGVLLTRGVEVMIATRNPGHYQRLSIADVISPSRRLSTAQGAGLSNGSVSFRMSGPAAFNFSVYDSVVAGCTATDGLLYSDVYPCGCGAAVCQQGERCDMHCGGQGGCCHAPVLVPGQGGFVLPTPGPTVSARGDPHLVNLQGEHFDVNHGGEFTLLRVPQDESSPAELELKASILPEHGRPCTTYITEVELSGTWLGGKVVQVRSYRAKASGEASKFLGLRIMSRGATAESKPEEMGDSGEVPWEKLADWPDMAYLLSGFQGKTGYMVTLAKTQWHSRKGSGQGASSVAGQVEVRVQRRRHNESARIIMRQDLPLQEHLNLAVRQISALGREDVGGLLGFGPHPASLEAVSPECQRHRDGLDGPHGPHAKPRWKTRWEKIRERRAQADAHGGGTNDNEAAASLVTRAMMCVCAVGDASGARDAGPADGGDDDAEGVLAEFQTGRLAEATWD